MKKHRSFLKWAGGKYSLIGEICQYLPSGDVLVEPFVGAGSVFLNTNYQRYILNDINSDLIALFNHIKYQPERFIQDSVVFFGKEANQASVYYELRDAFNQSADTYYRSLLFFYLNRHCYNGLCRYNRKGEFNVPFGRYHQPYFPSEEIMRFSDKAQRAEFTCRSYEETMLNTQTGHVVYCDPPYVPLSQTSSFTAYHVEEFGIEHQQRLAQLAKQLASENIPVVISNHDTVLTREWYDSAQIYKVKTRRSISSKAMGRIKLDELLALF